jgi:hypothetical protein
MWPHGLQGSWGALGVMPHPEAQNDNPLIREGNILSRRSPFRGRFEPLQNKLFKSV